jgi:hypothetical protein
MATVCHKSSTKNATMIEMSGRYFPHKPRFFVGDLVRAVGPNVSSRENIPGTVIDILGSLENVIYRYRVKFPDGSWDVFFGFELELMHPAAEKAG